MWLEWMLSPGNTVRMQAVAEAISHGNNGKAEDKGPASMATGDWKFIMGNKGLCRAHGGVDSGRALGPGAPEMASGDRLTLVPQGGWTLHVQCPRGATVSDTDGADSRGRGPAEPSQCPSSWKAGVAVGSAVCEGELGSPEVGWLIT